MDKSEIKQLLITAIKKFQTMSGEDIPELNDDTTPIGDCPGFDSQRGVEVIVDLETQLGFEVPGEVNLFVSEDGRKALRIQQIVDRIYKLISKLGKKSHG